MKIILFELISLIFQYIPFQQVKEKRNEEKEVRVGEKERRRAEGRNKKRL